MPIADPKNNPRGAFSDLAWPGSYTSNEWFSLMAGLMNFGLGAVTVQGTFTAGPLTTAAKGATAAGSPTSTAASADRQLIDVALRDPNTGLPQTIGGGSQFANNSAQASSAVGTIALGYDGTTVRALKTDASGNSQVAVASALPTGSNTIGGVNVIAALPAGSNTIGGVNVIAALPAGANTIGGVNVVAALPAGANAIGSVTVSNTVAIQDVKTTATSTFGASAAVVLASNASRKTFFIQNAGIVPLYVYLGASGTTTTASWVLAAGVANQDGLGGNRDEPSYTGAVSCAVASGSILYNVVEYV